ncbi:hypothetical protein IW262DRAFT_981211 [Armillaria fumosa]|nr:hypothetical protein IW262DRAFT_981211 [Armillaria fumosa]
MVIPGPTDRCIHMKGEPPTTCFLTMIPNSIEVLNKKDFVLLLVERAGPLSERGEETLPTLLTRFPKILSLHPIYMFLGLDIEMHRFSAPFMRRFSAASFFVGPMYKHPSTVLCITLIRCGLLTGNGGSFATCPSLREKRKAFNLLFAAPGIKNTAYGSRASPARKAKFTQSVARILGFGLDDASKKDLARTPRPFGMDNQICRFLKLRLFVYDRRQLRVFNPMETAWMKTKRNIYYDKLALGTVSAVGRGWASNPFPHSNVLFL